MATYTQLSPIASPGKRYSFSAKGLATGEKGEGPFTRLSVLASPGSIHSFSAKEPAIPSGKGEGPFTTLSVLGIPGMLHVFVAKEFTEPAVPPPPPPPIPSGGGTWLYSKRYDEYEYKDPLRKRRIREDREMIEIITTIVLPGRLN